MICGRIAADTPSIADVRAGLLNLYEHEYLLVIRMIMRLGASLQDAEDAVQEAFAEAWASLIERPDKWARISDPRQWIRAIALKKYWRPPTTRRQPPPLPVPEIPENVPDAAISHDELTLGTLYVLDVQRNLDPLLQAILTFHMDGYSARDIAAILGIKDDQETRDLLKKARKILRRELSGSRNQERRSS